jgi:hypothetical protein
MTGGCLYKHGGKEYWLVYTADAYFEIKEQYGTEPFDRLRADDRSGWDCAVGCLLILAREGELCRRYMGYEPLPMLDEETIRRTVLPDGVVNVKNAVAEAIFAGMRIANAKKDNQPVDIGLLEFEKKTIPG